MRVDAMSLERSLSALLRKEGTAEGAAQLPRSYVRLNPRYLNEVQRDGMIEAWRQTIVGFFLELSERFEAGGKQSMDPNIIPTAMNLLDRYLSVKSCSAVMFQQAALIALQISSKIHGFRPIVPLLLIKLSNNRFTQRQLLVMEKDMLMTLRWDLNPSTVVRVLEHFKLMVLHDVNLTATPTFDQHLHECVDITTVDYDMLRFPPSYIAWAVLSKAFALTRAEGHGDGLVNAADDNSTGEGVPIPMTLFDLPVLPPMASHVWSPDKQQMHECTRSLNRLYREHKGLPEEEEDDFELSNAESEAEMEAEAEANAEVASFSPAQVRPPPSTPSVTSPARGETPNGVESDEIFGDPHESTSAVAVAKPVDAAAVAVAAVAAAIAKRVSKRQASDGFTEEASAAANLKRRKSA